MGLAGAALSAGSRSASRGTSAPTARERKVTTMADKYHNEWIIRDIVTEHRIVNSQIDSFRFLSDMAHIFDSTIEMLKGSRQIPVMLRQLDLMKRKCFYLEMANSIGRLWLK